MNLAPYILARKQGFTLPEYGAHHDLAQKALKDNEGFIEQISARIQPWQVIDFAQFTFDKRGFVGLFSLTNRQLKRMVSRDTGWKESATEDGTPIRMLDIATGMLKDLEWLMFPDDLNASPNVSLFCPSFRAPDKFDLHSLTFALDFDERSLKEIMFGRKPCTVSVSGSHPNRTFDCATTGCTNQCRLILGYESNFSRTVNCECS